MTIATTYEELKKYDRTVVRFNNTEGLLYLFDGKAFFLSNKMDGASPKDNGEWKHYGYKYSWCIHPDFYGYIELTKPIVDFDKLDEILIS